MALLIPLLHQNPHIFSPRSIIKHIIKAVPLVNKTIPQHKPLVAQIEPGIS